VSANGREFRERLARVEDLVSTLEACPDPVAREAARELVRSLLDLHAAGLTKVLELSEPTITTRLAADGLVSSLLLLHGLHPHSAEQRVTAALERARPQFRTLGGSVELISATNELVRLRLGGDPSVGAELRTAVESLVIEAVPDVTAIEFEEAWDRLPDGRVPLPLLRGAT
jgi:hypothetical protein